MNALTLFSSQYDRSVMLQLHITNIDIASINDASCISTLCVDCNNSVMHVR